MRVSPSCIRQTYALSSSPPETANELFTGSIDTEKTEADHKDSEVNEIKKQNIPLNSHVWHRGDRCYHCFHCYATFEIKMLKIAIDFCQSYGNILYGILVGLQL